MAKNFKEKTEVSIPEVYVDLKCLHGFGYLSQRPKNEEIPSECLTCVKLLECMLSENKSEAFTSQRKNEKSVVQQTSDLMEKRVEKTVKIELSQLREHSELEAEASFSKLSGDHFTVENLGMLYATWSNTVRIPREALSSWGVEIEEVEIETAKGKKAVCKVRPMEGPGKTVVQVPDKVQLSLEVKKGDVVRVKPIIAANRNVLPKFKMSAFLKSKLQEKLL